VRCTSGVDGPSLRKIVTSTKGFSWSSTTTTVRQSLMWRPMTVLSARWSTRLKYTFSRCSFDVIFCASSPFACFMY
jgi:hypothetical protein